MCVSAPVRDSEELLISLTYFSATSFTPAVSGLGGRRHLSDSGQLTRHRRAAAAHLVDANVNKRWISTGLASRSDGGSVDANPPKHKNGVDGPQISFIRRVAKSAPEWWMSFN